MLTAVHCTETIIKIKKKKKMLLAYSNDLKWRIGWLYYYKEKSIEEIQCILFGSSRSVRQYLTLSEDCMVMCPQPSSSVDIP